MSQEDLAVLAARAKLRYRGNISAVVHEMAEVLRREEAMDALIRELGADRVPDAEIAELRAELGGQGARPARPAKKPKRRTAA